MRGLIQATVTVTQGLYKISGFRKRDSLLQRDVDVTPAVGGVVLNPPRTARMQPRLNGADIGFYPVNTGD
jgi:hypothetical protein